MSLLENGGFDTGEIRRALDEYDRREQKRNVQMGAVFLQSMRLLEDAGRLYEENDRLKELVQDYDKALSSMYALCDCDFVPLNDATLLALRSRMYELGIEVE